MSESDRSAVAVGPDGTVLARYPATVGSEHDPLPVGPWKINGVARDPSFNYNPDLFWDSEPGDEKAKLPSGPNNPVGMVWIDLSKPHYGIHGAPAPSTIGGTTSHGCIRLTNWDALELGHLVSRERMPISWSEAALRARSALVVALLGLGGPALAGTPDSRVPARFRDIGGRSGSCWCSSRPGKGSPSWSARASG